ncbi:MAG: TIR domain-containing protein [Acidobacteria bacterium]|nr:TIR domain-containing protein [Acidobacteriota bacterium]
MPRIFISYRKSDSPGVTGRLADALHARFGRDAVFWDERSLEGGEPWPERLREGLAECGVLRGGSWGSYHDVARAAFRGLNLPDLRDYGIGFRLVCSAPIPAGR